MTIGVHAYISDELRFKGKNVKNNGQTRLTTVAKHESFRWFHCKWIH